MQPTLDHSGDRLDSKVFLVPGLPRGRIFPGAAAGLAWPEKWWSVIASGELGCRST